MAPVRKVHSGVLTFVGALAAAGLACSDSSATPSVHGAGPGVIGSATQIDITPSSAALNQGGRAVLRCAAFDVQGVMLPNQPVWTSSDQTVATVGSDGSVTAQRPGSASVTCQIGGRSATSAITVSTARIAFVEVSPGAGTLPTGGSLQLVGVPRDSLGFQVPGSDVQWSSADTSIAAVSSSGVVKAKGSGDADIRAVSGGVAGMIKVKVSPTPPTAVASVSLSVDQTSLSAGSMTHAAATTTDANGQVLTGRAITWSTSNPTVLSAVTTNPTRANVRALAQGSSALIATSEGVSASVTITVGAPTVAIVATSLASSSILIGQTTLASAVPEDGLGNPLSGHTVTWSSLDPTIASVSSSGVVTGVAAGSVIIRATSDGITGDASLTVTAAAVASVSTTLGSSSLTTGQTTQATAVARDASGKTLTGRYVAWSSLNPSIATVSITGLVTAVAPGTATIRATVESKTGDATLVVQAPATTPAPSPSVVQPVDTDSVFVSNPRTWVNGTAPATLVQTPLNPLWTAAITGAAWIWRTPIVANPMAVEVDTFTRRFVPSVTARTVTLDVASDNGFKALVNGTLVVDRLGDTGPTYSTVSHYVVPVSALVAGTNTLTIIVQNNANTLSSDPALNPAGLLYRFTLSTALPTSTASVAVTLDSAYLGTGHTSNATVVAKDATGATLSGKTPTWASQNTSIATVNATTGVVTGVSSGSTRIQATIDGVVGSAPLTVTVPSVITVPAPSGSGTHPNEPTGFAQLAAQSFDAIENTDYYPSGVGNPSIVSDPTNPGSSSNVGQVLYPAGFVSGSAPGSEWGKHVYSPRIAYISFFVKVSSNWYGNDGAGANKVLYWNMIPASGGNAVSQGSIEIFGTGSGNLVPGLACNVTGFVQGSDNPIGAAPTVKLDANRGSALVTRGVWHRYEVLIIANTPGNTDGGVKWWFDGTLIGDYTNRIKFNDIGAPPADIFWSPTYGGSGNPVPANQYMWLKDLYISGK